MTGLALSYELAKKDLKVLFLDKEVNPLNAPRYNYEGFGYWSETNE
ncbi:MAG: hypothetical protein ACTMUB_06170 [cyanobacterium endosymbiont of Rhopalodia musculus]